MKHRSKDVINQIDSLLHFINITTKSTGKTDQVLLLSSPLDDITRHAWKVSQIRQFRITNLGISIEFCPYCYKTQTPQHRSFSLFIRSSNINVCVEFLYRKTNARAVAESLMNNYTYRIQDHHCPTPNPLFILPPPTLPSKPNSDRPSVPPRIHPQFGYLNGPPAEPYAPQAYSRKKPAPKIKFDDMLCPYRITSRIVINNDGTVSHESTVLGHLGNRTDKSPLTPMRSGKQAKGKLEASNLFSTKSSQVHKHLKNTVSSSFLPPRNVLRFPSRDIEKPKYPLPVAVPSNNTCDEEDYENEWFSSDPIQKHKPLSYIEPVSSKEDLRDDDDDSTDYVNMPDYMNLPDYLNMTGYINVPEMNDSLIRTNCSSPDYVDEVSSLICKARPESPTPPKWPSPKVNTDSDVMDKDFINVTEILKEIYSPVESAPPLPTAPLPTVTSMTATSPVIKKRTLRALNSNASLGVVLPKSDPSTMPKTSTPSSASARSVSKLSTPVPWLRQRSSSDYTNDMPVSSVPPQLISSSDEDRKPASSVSSLVRNQTISLEPPGNKSVLKSVDHVKTLPSVPKRTSLLSSNVQAETGTGRRSSNPTVATHMARYKRKAPVPIPKAKHQPCEGNYFVWHVHVVM